MWPNDVFKVRIANSSQFIAEAVHQPTTDFVVARNQNRPQVINEATEILPAGRPRQQGRQ